MTLDALKEELAGRADVLLGDLLGKPTSQNAREWRWGRHGSLSYSPSLGTFYDHEEQRGGSLLDLIARERGCSFGDAADFAREWLGGHAELPARPKPAPMARCNMLVAARSLWSGARSVHGTAAARYLDSRGIAQAPQICAAMISAPAFAATAGMEWWRWPAAAFLLTTADGKASAVQLVALREDGVAVGCDGRKVKRTIGPMAGAAFRMPATLTGGPLLLAEGPETGLACWQSTEAETWALCGPIARADLSSIPVKRLIVVCADDDPADAPAAESLRLVVNRWAAEGREVRCAYPWPSRRYDKSDFADVLLQEGNEAVRGRLLRGAE